MQALQAWTIHVSSLPWATSVQNMPSMTTTVRPPQYLKQKTIHWAVSLSLPDRLAWLTMHNARHGCRQFSVPAFKLSPSFSMQYSIIIAISCDHSVRSPWPTELKIWGQLRPITVEQLCNPKTKKKLFSRSLQLRYIVSDFGLWLLVGDCWEHGVQLRRVDLDAVSVYVFCRKGSSLI